MSLFNLFGGGDETSSSSSTVQTTTTQNAATFATNGGVSNSSTVNGSNNWTQFNNETVSDDVAIRAMDNVLTMGQDALLFGADAQRQAYGFASDSQKTALSFADAQVKGANATTQAAVGSVNDLFTKALTFGSKQTGVAIDSLSQSASMLDNAYKDAKGVLSNQTIVIALVAGAIVLVFALKKK